MPARRRATIVLVACLAMGSVGATSVAASSADSRSTASRPAQAALADRTAPVVHRPVATLRLGSGFGSTAQVRIDFLAHDAGAGISTGNGGQVAISRNGGRYVTLTSGVFTGGAVPWVTVPGDVVFSVFRSFAVTGSYRLRVRAHDRAGNWSRWVYGPTLLARMLQETSPVFHYAGGWSRVAGPWSGGYAETASSAGATATATFSANAIAWVARRGPGLGSAEVWMDGVLVSTVNLASSPLHPRTVVFSRRWSSSGTHTMVIKVIGTGLPVEIDGLLDLR